jgi:biopolymer transport protein ExbD
MGLKKNSKVSAEFNMSSLTDIIFLLLIFFMLTSSLVVPNALNLQLPGKKSSTTAPSKTSPTQITIDRKGKYRVNGSSSSFKNIDKKIKGLKSNKKAIVVLTPSKTTPNQYVVKVLDSAYRHGVKIKLTDPR